MGNFLNGLFVGKYHRRFIKFTPAKFNTYAEKARQFALNDNSLSFAMGADRWGDYADDYGCKTLTTSPMGESEYNQLSYLRWSSLSTGCKVKANGRNLKNGFIFSVPNLMFFMVMPDWNVFCLTVFMNGNRMNIRWPPIIIM